MIAAAVLSLAILWPAGISSGPVCADAVASGSPSNAEPARRRPVRRLIEAIRTRLTQAVASTASTFLSAVFLPWFLLFAGLLILLRLLR